MRIFTYLFLLAVIIIGITFAYLNANPVSFNYYIGVEQISLSMLLAAAVGTGLLLGLFFTFVTWVRLKTRIFKLKSKLKTAEQEVANLREIPIKNRH